MTLPSKNSLARALGRIPSGLFVVTTLRDGARIGFLGSFVQQVGFEPPTVCIGVAKGRAHLENLLAGGRFALSILDKESLAAKSAFLKRLPEGVSPFDGLRVGAAPAGMPILLDALAWLECRVVGRHDTGDHAVLFGEVTDGELAREGDPHVHVRKNGLSY